MEETGEEFGAGSCIGIEMFGKKQPAHFNRTVIACTDVDILEISWDEMQHLGSEGKTRLFLFLHCIVLCALRHSPLTETHVFLFDADNKEAESGVANGAGSCEKGNNSPLPTTVQVDLPLTTPKKLSQAYTRDDLHVRLESIGVLGKGAFGRVELVQDKRDDSFVAIKIQHKQHLVDIAAVQKVQQERCLLMSISHPFICQLYSTFQDQDCVYMALQFLRGGELFSLVDRKGGALSVADTKFYAAPLVSALEYLHQRHIVYRDVKTENVVLDHLGYPLLVDFGFAKQLSNDSGITFTICGTPEFLAPEVILGSGHGIGSDCWSFGIMVHELLSGFTPFSVSEEGEGEGEVDPMVVIQLILEGKVQLSSELCLDKVTEMFVLALLDRNQATRLGCGQQLLMSQHEFFSCEEEEVEEKREVGGWWDRVGRRECVAPWCPLAMVVGSEEVGVDVREYFEIDRLEKLEGWSVGGFAFVGSDELFEGF